MNGSDINVKMEVKDMKKYRDIDTNEIYTEEDLRDWFYSLEEDDREGQETPEDWIFYNSVMNGGCLEVVYE